MFTIREMTSDDAPKVRDIWAAVCAAAGYPLPDHSHQLILSNLQQYPAHDDVGCFVAEQAGQLVGFITWWLSRHPIQPGQLGEIEELLVLDVANQDAIRRELVRHTVVTLKESGVGVVRTSVSSAPEDAADRAFWTELGWSADQILFNIYSDSGDSVLQAVWDQYTT